MICKWLQALSMLVLVLVNTPNSQAQSITEKFANWFSPVKVPPITDAEHDQLKERMSAYEPSAYYRMASATAVGAGVARNQQTAVTYSLVAAALADREGDADTALQARKLVDRLQDNLDRPSQREAEAAAESIVAERDKVRRYKDLWEEGKKKLGKAVDAITN